MISRGRLSKSWLRVNKTKWCREARLRKTLYKPLNGSQTKGSQRENLLKKDKIKPFSEYHSRQNASFTDYLSFKKYKSFVKKFPQPPPQVYHQRTNCTKDPKRGERRENWPDFLPPRDYFGDNSSRDRKRRRSKFSGVRAFGKLLTEWLQLNNTAINPGCCCPTGIPLNVYTSPFD